MALPKGLKGQMTIVDITDSRELAAYIQTTNRRQVIHDPDTDEYSPDYGKEEMSLIPELLTTGTGSNIISDAKSVSWEVQTNSSGTFDALPEDGTYTIGENYELVINTNILEANLSMLYRVYIVYHDERTNRDIPIIADMELIKLENGSSGTDGEQGEDAVLAVVETPNGTTIRNHEGTLTAIAETYKGVNSVEGETFKWYKREPTADGDSTSGQGWEPLDSTNPYNVTGFDTDTLTVPPEGIRGSETYMVIISYEGNDYRRSVTFDDITDAYSSTILGYNFFHDGGGENTYVCKLYQSGTEVDPQGTLGYTYIWHQYDIDGNLVNPFEKRGKIITLNADEFQGKGELEVSVID